MARFVMCLVYKREDLDSIPRTHIPDKTKGQKEGLQEWDILVIPDLERERQVVPEVSRSAIQATW